MTDPKTKRILYVITKSNFGGSQRYVFELALAMQEAGNHVAVASAPTGLLVEKLNQSGIQHIPINSFQRDMSIRKEIKALQEIQCVYQNFKPDIVHLNSSKAGGLGSVVAQYCRIPTIVFTAHGWPFLEPRSLAWKTGAWIGSYITALLSHKVILVSHDGLRHTNMPFVRNKVAVVKNAVPTIDFYTTQEARQKLFSAQEIEVHRNDIWVLTTAELNHNKNLFLAISAVTKYNKQNKNKIYYAIAGDGENKEKLEKHIETQGATEYIKLLGYVDQARRYLHAFNIFLLPSLKEGMPYAVLEAGSAGMAIIASKTGGIPEIVDDATNGLLFDPLSIENLVHKLTIYTENALIRNEHALQIKNKVAKEFSAEKMYTETHAVYNA